MLEVGIIRGREKEKKRERVALAVKMLLLVNQPSMEVWVTIELGVGL